MRDEAGRRDVLRRIMRRQAAVSLRIAAAFVAVLVLLPLLNLYAPAAMTTSIGGFPLSWLLLAILFYPFTWILSFLFVKSSDEIEGQMSAEFRGTGELGASELELGKELS